MSNVNRTYIQKMQSKAELTTGRALTSKFFDTFFAEIQAYFTKRVDEVNPLYESIFSGGMRRSETPDAVNTSYVLSPGVSARTKRIFHLHNSLNNKQGLNTHKENTYGTHRHNPAVHHCILPDDMGIDVHAQRKKAFVRCIRNDVRTGGFKHQRTASALYRKSACDRVVTKVFYVESSCGHSHTANWSHQ